MDFGYRNFEALNFDLASISAFLANHGLRNFSLENFFSRVRSLSDPKFSIVCKGDVRPIVLVTIRVRLLDSYFNDSWRTQK